MIHLDPSVAPFVHKCMQRTPISVTTSQSFVPKSSMKKDHGEIDHQYNVWRLSKWVIKKLSKKAEVKGCEDLHPWTRSLSNQMWCRLLVVCFSLVIQ